MHSISIYVLHSLIFHSIYILLSEMFSIILSLTFWQVVLLADLGLSTNWCDSYFIRSWKRPVPPTKHRWSSPQALNCTIPQCAFLWADHGASFSDISCLSACLPQSLLGCLPQYLPPWLPSCQPAWLTAWLTVCLHASLLACRRDCLYAFKISTDEKCFFFQY